MELSGETRHAGSLAIVLAVVLITAFAPAATAVELGPTGTAATTLANGVQNPSQVPDSQVFEGTTDGQIEVWKRVAFPLRTDDTGAATQVPLPTDLIGATGFGEKDLVATFGTQKNPAGVHDAGTSVSLTFDDGRANSGDLNNQQRVDVVAARITGSGEGFPETYSDFVDLLGDVQNANENATFEMISNSDSLDGGGENSWSYTPSQSGQYVLFAAVHQSGQNGFEVSSGDISVDGDVVMIGIDQLTVQSSSSSVSVSDGAPGDTFDFSVDASSTFSGSPSVTHVVALYNRSRFESSRFELEVDDSQLGPNFDISSDSTLKHSLQDVNGVADVEDGITINGVDLSDGRVARTVGAGQVVDFIATDLGTTSPSTTAVQEGGRDNNAYEDLNASVTAISGANPQATVSVETFANFSGGQYRYVVYSMRDDDSSVMGTTTGTVLLDATAPTAVTGSDRTVTVDTTFQFDGTGSSDAGTGISAYDWDIGADGSYELSGATPSYTFSTTGTYTVRLRVTDGAGNTATDTVTITVETSSSGGGGGGGGGGGTGGGGGDDDDDDDDDGGGGGGGVVAPGTATPTQTSTATQTATPTGPGTEEPETTAQPTTTGEMTPPETTAQPTTTGEMTPPETTAQPTTTGQTTEPPATQTATPTQPPATTTTSGPGFGPVLGLVAILAAALLIRRRRR